MKSFLGALAALLFAACASTTQTTDRELERVEQRMARHEENLDRTEVLVRALEAKWSTVVAEYTQASAAYRAAKVEYERASAAYSQASDGFRAASATWESARVRWELARQLIVAAAAIDAYNLARLQGGSRVDLGKIDCGRVSTRTFRRRLKAQGVDLTGKDIDHIVPRSRGGADHPLNYQVLDSGLNRSLGASWGAEKCALSGPAICKAAVAVSEMCGSFRG